MSGLYLHIPFCKQKCYYCDFHFSVSLKNKDTLLAALKKELVLRKSEVSEPIETIYFGGGTPSLLSYEDLNELFETIYSNYTIIPYPEITLESNPDDLSKTYIKNIEKLPVNRLSIGVQSFFDEDLLYMNRAHNSEEAKSAILNVQNMGLENISIDLIYGIPEMSSSRWQRNLDKFLALNIPHLSSYALTVEPKTALYHFIQKKKYTPMNDTLSKEHFDILVNVLKSNEYQHYELSNFAKKSSLSKHNTSYWKGKSYLGIGPSAHSYDLRTRSWNVANNARYIKSLMEGKLPLKVEVLSLSDKYNEYIMTGLRTVWGVDRRIIKRDFSDEINIFFSRKSATFIKTKQLRIKDVNLVVVSPEAFFLIDGIISDLFWID